MNVKTLYPEVNFENEKFEFKADLEADQKSEKWGKTLVGFANGKGGKMFAGVSDKGEAFGITFETVDKCRQLIYRENDRHFIPHIVIDVQIKSIDYEGKLFVMAVSISPSSSLVAYRRGDYSSIFYARKSGATLPPTADELLRM